MAETSPPSSRSWAFPRFRGSKGWHRFWTETLVILLLGGGCGSTVDEHLAGRNRGRIAHVQTALVMETALSKKYELRIPDGRGGAYAYYLRTPRGARERIPAVLILAGFETGREALNFIDERDDVLLLSMDYPSRELQKLQDLTSLRAVPTIRRLVVETLEGASLALDYLWAHPQMDRERLILLGVSFGSLFTTILGGLDERARAVVLIYGGGDLPLLIRHNLRQKPWWLPSWLIAPLAQASFGDFEPLLFVDRIAPRFFLMINSRRDEMVPPASVLALYERAKEPKKLIWYETGHLDLFDPSLIRRLTQEVVAELDAAGYLPPLSRSRP